MDDSHPNLRTFRSDPAAKRRARVTVQRPSRLGQTLREAREDNRLELEDLAEITNIRLSYLEALEAGHFAALPSDEGRNVVRRYAQAVGLDPARALLLYAQERRLAVPNGAKNDDRTGLELPLETRSALPGYPRLGRFVRLFASLLLVAAAIWLALRAFDGALSFTSVPAPGQTGQTQPQALPEPSETIPAAVTATQAAAPQTASAPAMILLSLQTTPPGAEVSIDGYRFAQSPIIDAPVRAGNRTLKVERGGYGTFERTLDLSRDRRLSVTLFPKGAGQPTMTGAAPAWTQNPALTNSVSTNTSSEPVPTTATQVVVTVSAEAWLEVYQSSARGEGERLVYTTAQPGETYSFSAPVYIFSGNAGGVSVAEGDASARPLGTPGAVVGAAY